MRKMFQGCLLLAGILLTGGCCGKVCPPAAKKTTPEKPLMTLVAKYSSTPIKLDGQLDDPAWQNACVYQLGLSEAQIEKEEILQAPGEIRLLWDDQYLYIGATFCDDDIVAEGKNDQDHHYKLGDLCEVFLKSDSFTWYWELYGTPLGKKTSFWFPGRGRLGLPSMKDYRCGLMVAARVHGTLNDWRDKDEYWSVELAMPIKDLIALGGTFGPESDWRILIARYNYSRYLDCQGPQYSMVPQLSAVNYHLIDEYARLKLEK
jgi:hypothetical protein